MIQTAHMNHLVSAVLPVSASYFVLCSGGALGNVVLIPRVLKGRDCGEGRASPLSHFQPYYGSLPSLSL
jgi:hypothetical protein